MIPAVISLGPLTFHLYGLIVGLGIVVGAEIAVRVGKRHGLAEAMMWTAAGWALIGGLGGARAYHVIDQWEYYHRHLVEILWLWQGGLGIWGV